MKKWWKSWTFPVEYPILISMKNTTASTPLRDEQQVTMAVDPAASALTVQQVLGQVALIQQIMVAAMKDGEHYGKIPGCGSKPTLLKPGAEKLCLTFRLAPTYVVEERLLERGHREYRVQCTLSSIITKAFIGQGVGVCSTMEAKYRYRQNTAEPTDKPVPRAYWDVRGEDPAKAQELIGGRGFSVKKVDGKGWMIARGGEKVEHDNPADHYNTVLKMAKKRALVDAVLTATAASDIFTQDLEDITANLALATPPVVSEAAPATHDQPARSVAAPVAVAAPAAQLVEIEEDDFEPAEAVAEVDFRETRIHFGKNRGLMLSELSPQQVHWYEHDWMPKKEVNGPTSVEDLALITALKAYSAWRSGGVPSTRNEKATPAAPRNQRRTAVEVDAF